MKVLILDAYNLMHRARSGFTKGDYPVVYNFFRGLRPLVEKFKPDVIYFVLEGMPKQNLALLGEYKGSREVDAIVDPKKAAAYADFRRQREIIVSLVENYMPMICVRHPDYEADDVMGLLAMRHIACQDDVTIVSGDSDMIQLLQQSQELKLYHPIKKEFLSAPPFNYVAWKALVGDKTDDIPGVPGVGPKTAEKLLESKKLMIKKILGVPENYEIYMRNLSLIELHVKYQDYPGIEFRPGMIAMEDLRAVFEGFKFATMIKPKTWQKYVDTFKCVTVASVTLDDSDISVTKTI